jgi:hypothetical protein
VVFESAHRAETLLELNVGTRNVIVRALLGGKGRISKFDIGFIDKP